MYVIDKKKQKKTLKCCAYPWHVEAVEEVVVVVDREISWSGPNTNKI